MADSCFFYFFLFYTVFSQQWYCLGVHLVFCPLFLSHCGIRCDCSLMFFEHYTVWQFMLFLLKY